MWPPTATTAIATERGKPFATLSRALRVATYGDTVYVRGGTYRESVWLEPPNRTNLNTGLGSWDNMLTINPVCGRAAGLQGLRPGHGWVQESGAIWRRTTGACDLSKC